MLDALGDEPHPIPEHKEPWRGWHPQIGVDQDAITCGRRQRSATLLDLGVIGAVVVAEAKSATADFSTRRRCAVIEPTVEQLTDAGAVGLATGGTSQVAAPPQGAGG